MAERTAISWCDATFNPWMGCTRVSPACDHCYAERLVTGRMGMDVWGSGKPRHRTSASNWKKAGQWNKTPDRLIGSQWPGRKPRVFAASLADIFDNEIDQTWRDDFWELVCETPNLQWLIVTKRIGNAARMLPPDWGNGYANVTLLITIANQEEADRDVLKLVATPAHQRGLSIEPMLGPVDISNWMFGPDAPCQQCPRDFDCECGWKTRRDLGLPGIDWVICGGESGPGARPLHPDWVRDLRYQCSVADVPFHFKQWGEWSPTGSGAVYADVGEGLTAYRMVRVGHQQAGRLLDGVEHNAFPEAP